MYSDYLMEKLILVLSFLCALLISPLTTCSAVDTIAANQSIRDGETIVSAGGSFELGFFSPRNSRNRYLGIWYKKISSGTVIWVANRDTPIANGTSGVLRVDTHGSLQILGAGDLVIWSSNSSRSIPRNQMKPVAKLLDNGNLVVMDEDGSDPEKFIWQSFEHPTDTIVPGMKFGKSLVTGEEWYVTSWKTIDDPSPGEYSIWLNPKGYPQPFKRKGSVLLSRLGPWNGVRFSGFPTLKPSSLYTDAFVVNETDMYYTMESGNSSIIMRDYLNPEGVMQQLNWIDRTQSWFVYMSLTMDSCSRFGVCGAYGSCNIGHSPICSCMNGFEPKRPDEWSQGDWSSGCRRKVPLECGNGDGFLKFTGVEFPDTQYTWYNRSMTLEECEIMCKKNCNCTAYANLDIRDGGSGCLQWFGDIIDVRVYPEVQDLYVRMAATEVRDEEHIVPTSESKKRKGRIVYAAVSASAALILLGLVVALIYAWNKKKRTHGKRFGRYVERIGKGYSEGHEDIELPLFSLSRIAKSTSDFSIESKLGEGGFGPVYKGLLEDGQEIAVKRLSKGSTQGLDEFKNEVMCIARLQHRNLVKLLGYCIQDDELMLIYEYMPNKSLDLFIFDEQKKALLDWPQRFSIIHGIARGLLYLHQDSRLRIIHRDLKAANILLDFDMTPKISDFGIARSFNGFETRSNTNRVVGTYGYMSPEYAVNGIFSVKSDVFSFGVLLLEIVSGKKNREFSYEERNDNLLGHAWRLYKEGKSHELMDTALWDSSVVSEVLRSIHIGLLCVQRRAEDRPTMSSVILMLGSEGTLPPPKQPAFFNEDSAPEFESISSDGTLASVDEVTITLLQAR